MKLEFNIEGEKQLSRKLRNLKNKNLRPAFQRAGRQLVKFYSTQVFSTEGAVIGEKWKGGPQYHGLVRSGSMKRLFRYRTTEQMLEVRNDADYFKYHQSNKPRKRLPRRVMIKLDEPRRQIILKEVQKEYLDELQSR